MNNLALYNKIFQKKNLLQWNGKKIFFQKYNLLLKNKNKRFYYLKSFPFLKNSYQNFSDDNLFNKKNINSSNIIRKIFLSVSFGVLALGILIQKAIAEEKDRTLEEDEKAVEEAGKFIEGLPVYSKSEVAKHNNPETGIWVTFKNGVYDITEFIEFHPGHDKILLASGAAVEPFWAFYSQHYTANVVELLEQYRIGNLSNEDAQSNSENIQDAYFNDPERPPYFIIRQKKPFNAETPSYILVENSITSNEHFFIRNHLPVPDVNPDTYILEITGENLQEPVKLTLQDLKTKFPKENVEVAIQCCGNRRRDFLRVKEVQGLTWGPGAISNAIWSGPRLRDVLHYAGINEESGMKHIQFQGLDKDFERSYGASIPIEKALSSTGDVILAYEMNGKDIPRDHGYPVRVIVPGVTGARSVKWLHQIHASREESPSHWQQRDYKGFPPNTNWNKIDWNSAPAIQEYPVQSAICDVKITPEKDKLFLKGYAASGGGKGIIRVDITLDDGKNWYNAELKKPNQPYNRVWAWTLWEATIPLPKEIQGKKIEICCRAVDSAYNTQLEKADSIWNLRGLLCNSWHRVDIEIPLD